MVTRGSPLGTLIGPGGDVVVLAEREVADSFG